MAQNTNQLFFLHRFAGQPSQQNLRLRNPWGRCLNFMATSSPAIAADVCEPLNGNSDWKLVPLVGSNGPYKMVSQASQKCIHSIGSPLPSASIANCATDYTPGQLWNVVSLDGAFVQLQNLESNKCLASALDSGMIALQNCGSFNSQKFLLDKP
jgi:hypothetical protein